MLLSQQQLNIMIQQQEIETAITKLTKGGLSQIKTFKLIKDVIKTLEHYISNSQVILSQRFVPCCLFIIPQRFQEILNLEPLKILQEKPEKMSHNLLLQSYLKCMPKLLQESSDQIKHIIVEGMSKGILLTGPYVSIMKKWMKCLLDLWATCNDNLNIALRCHLALSKFCSQCDSNLYMWVLRRMYVSYFENSKQVSWRNFEHINFMINSMCEIIRINTQRAYYVLFGYLRSLALELDKLNKVKRKQKIDLISKLYSNQILNCFKLFSSVVSRVDNEELTALIYPLCELLAAYERVSQSAEYIPLKLHLLDLELTMIQSLEIYIPHTFQLLEKLLKSPIFNRKISKKSEKVEANIEIAYKLSKSELTQAQLINELYRSLITKVYWFEHLVTKHCYSPQLIQQLELIIKKQEFSFSEYRNQAKKIVTSMKADRQQIYEIRAHEKMPITNQKKIMKFQNKLRKLSFQGSHQYAKMKKEQEEMLKRKLAAEEGEQNSEEIEEVGEDEDEVNSGWEEASEGASDFEMEKSESEESESVEQVSYQGDPEDVDEAAKQWSQQQWDSQSIMQ